MRGRPRKPKTLKVFEGNPRNEDLGYVEPVAKGDAKKPSGLGRYGSAHWDLIYEHVKHWGVGKVDRDSLTSLCLWWQKFREYDKVGDVYKAKAAHGEWLKLAARFGLSPADRARLRTDDTQGKDDFEDFLERKKG